MPGSASSRTRSGAIWPSTAHAATASVWRLHYDPQIRVPFAEAADADIDMWEQWDRITCPCLVLRGAESPLLLSEVASAMATRGPRAKVEIVPGAGHAPALMEEGQIDLVRGFLGLP